MKTSLRYILLSLCLFISCLIYGQGTESNVHGIVTDAKSGEPLMSVSCRTYDKNGKLLTFGISDVDGKYMLRLSANCSYAEFKSIGYKGHRISVASLHDNSDVALEQDAVALQEVIVNIKPIEVHKDTINYNIAAFKDVNDRKLVDVLKKLPGIEVDEDGRVTYKGNSINSFNIEGQNLLGNRYNQATNSLPIDAVAQVQVMEHDHPIRALRGKVLSDKATLNIKLKSDYKAKMFGELSAGGGYGDEALWNVGGTAVRIARKNQLLATLQTNNTGNNLNEYAKEHIDVTDIDSYEPIPNNKLTTERRTFLPIDEKRFTFNKSISAGLNHSHIVGKYGNFRSNIVFYGNRINDSDSLVNKYGGSSPVMLHEMDQSTFKDWVLTPIFHYEHNAPYVFLIEELTTSFGKQTNNGVINSNYVGIDSKTNARPITVQNKLQMTLTLGKQILQVNSFVRYYRNQEKLVSDDISDNPIYNLDERLLSKRLVARNSFSTIFNVWGNELRLKYALEYRNNGLRIQQDRYDKYFYVKNSFSPEYTIKYSRGFVYVALPLNTQSSRMQWLPHSKNNRFYLTPSLRWSHHFNSQWRSMLSAGVTDDIAGEDPFSSFYFSNYRTKVSGLDNLGRNLSKSLSASLNYTNIISLFSWNMMVTSSWQKWDFYNSYTYDNQWSKIDPIWENVRSNRLLALTSVEKTWSKIRLFTKATVNFNHSEQPFIQNTVEYKAKSNIFSTSLSLSWTKLSWLQIYNDATFNLSWQDNEQFKSSNSLRSYYNTFRLQVHPIKKLNFGISANNNIIETEPSKYHSLTFVDASCSYIISKRIELTGRVTNLFNQTKYIEGYYSGINYFYYERPLRGIEGLFSISVNF